MLVYNTVTTISKHKEVTDKCAGGTGEAEERRGKMENEDRREKRERRKHRGPGRERGVKWSEKEGRRVS